MLFLVKKFNINKILKLGNMDLDSSRRPILIRASELLKNAGDINEEEEDLLKHINTSLIPAKEEGLDLVNLIKDIKENFDNFPNLKNDDKLEELLVFDCPECIKDDLVYYNNNKKWCNLVCSDQICKECKTNKKYYDQNYLTCNDLDCRYEEKDDTTLAYWKEKAERQDPPDNLKQQQDLMRDFFSQCIANMKSDKDSQTNNIKISPPPRPSLEPKPLLSPSLPLSPSPLLSSSPELPSYPSPPPPLSSKSFEPYPYPPPELPPPLSSKSFEPYPYPPPSSLESNLRQSLEPKQKWPGEPPSLVPKPKGPGEPPSLEPKRLVPRRPGAEIGNDDL